MSKNPRLRAALLPSLLVCAGFAFAQQGPDPKLDRQFQSAEAQFDAGRYREAVAQLEELLAAAPDSFAVHELLGQAYTALSQDARAVEHLAAAVRLQPDSAPARENLATGLLRVGKTEQAEEQFRNALALEPDDFDANHNLGEYYAQAGRLADAVPLLEHAQRIQPSSYDNGYDLALTEFLAGQLGKAKEQVRSLMEANNTADLHDLLGQIEEKSGDPVASVNEFETAAHLDPSEENLFDWGAELLVHRTYDPAAQVFQAAIERYPKSPRLRIGLGLTLDWEGRYDEAVKALLAAADLAPADPRCYLYLSKAYDSSPTQAEEVIARFRRYSELQPGNALAQYYYALSLWKGNRAGGTSLDVQTVESLLKKSIALDDKLAEAHLQLGELYSSRHDYKRSVPEYLRAVELNPSLSDGHFRLGTDYARIGQKEQAQKEIGIYQKLRAEHLAEVDKEKEAVQQFVYSSRAGAAGAH